MQQHAYGEMVSVAWVLLQISYAFQLCKNFETVRFDKVTESLKVGTFFETQCNLV